MCQSLGYQGLCSKAEVKGWVEVGVHVWAKLPGSISEVRPLRQTEQRFIGCKSVCECEAPILYPYHASLMLVTEMKSGIAVLRAGSFGRRLYQQEKVGQHRETRKKVTQGRYNLWVESARVW